MKTNNVHSFFKNEESWLRIMLDVSRDGIAIIDQNHRLVECNRSFAKMLGYSREELLAMHTWDWDAEMTEEMIRSRFSDFCTLDKMFETRHRRKDGSIYDVEISATGADISGRKIIVTICRDITERKREKESLMKTQFAMDQARDSIIWVDHEGVIVYANDSACSSLGYTRNELLKMKVFDIDPDFPADQFEQHKQDLQAQGSMTFESRHIAKDGRIFPVEVSTNYFGDKGRFLACAFDRDITKRKLAENALQESHTLLEKRVEERTAQLYQEIENRKKAEEELQALNHLQSLIMDLATSYINLPLTNIDMPINDSLAKMGTFVGADRTYVFEYDFKGQVCINTYEWCKEGISPQINELQAVPLSMMLEWVAVHKQGKPMYIPDVFALPHHNGVRRILEPQEIKSLVAVPMMDGPDCVGFVGFDSVTNHHFYSEKEQQLLTIFAQMLLNIRLRQEAGNKLSRHHRFQKMVASIATDFIGVSSSKIKANINTTLKQISRFLDVDRSYLFLLSSDNLTISSTHEYCHQAIEIRPEASKTCLFDDGTWYKKRILEEKSVIHIPDVADLPMEAGHEKAIFQKLNVKSTLSVPIYTNKRIYGIIRFDAVNKSMSWPVNQIHGLSVVAQILANALASIDSEQALLEAKAGLEQRVQERTQELRDQVAAKEQALADLAAAQSSLMEASRSAGMAEVATGVLHNVGNVLNSVNVSCTLLRDQLRESRVVNVSRVAGLMAEPEDGLARFFSEDPRGRQIPAYLASLGSALQEEHQVMSREAQSLHEKIEHIKEIVTMQQTYSRVSGVKETITPEQLMEDAIKLNSGALIRHRITVQRVYEPLAPIIVDKHKVLQILLNLINNAKYACTDSGNETKIITFRIFSPGPDRLRMQVTDSGIGIAPENMTRIFQHGFTTRKSGHGFGLHSGALAAHELGGSLTVHSDGPGLGATFTLELPYHTGDRT